MKYSDIMSTWCYMRNMNLLSYLNKLWNFGAFLTVWTARHFGNKNNLAKLTERINRNTKTWIVFWKADNKVIKPERLFMSGSCMEKMRMTRRRRREREDLLKNASVMFPIYRITDLCQWVWSQTLHVSFWCLLTRFEFYVLFPNVKDNRLYYNNWTQERVVTDAESLKKITQYGKWSTTNCWHTVHARNYVLMIKVCVCSRHPRTSICFTPTPQKGRQHNAEIILGKKRSDTTSCTIWKHSKRHIVRDLSSPSYSSVSQIRTHVYKNVSCKACLYSSNIFWTMYNNNKKTL